MFKKLMEKVDRLLGRGVIDDQLYEELEESLLQADASVSVVDSVLQELRQAVRLEKITTPEGIRERLQSAISSRLDLGPASRLAVGSRPTVYIFVGVNGAGKTTTIGKLAYRLRAQGKSVLLAAGDTFRAAAIEQLQMWAEKTGAEFVGAQPNSDTASVVFDAVTAAKARGIEYVLADTAGRQHTKAHLMNELQKLVRVTEKGLGRPPDEVLLVIDANTGQNAVRQAEEFQGIAGVTGVVVTKLDGTAKGGALLGLHDRLKLPVKLVGNGEKPADLADFSPDEFAKQMFD